MATGKFSIRALVTAIAIKVCEKLMVKSLFPTTFSTQWITCIITGKGAKNKWKVEWTLGNDKITSEHGSRALNPVGAQQNDVPVLQQPDSDTSSDSDESDTSEHLVDNDLPGPSAIDPPNGAAAAPQPAVQPSDPLLVHGLQWKDEQNGITSCFRESTGINNVHARILWPHNLRNDNLGKRPQLDYFKVFFPNQIEEICEWTSAKMKGSPINPYELFKFFGILIAMCCEPRRNRNHYWATGKSKVVQPSNFGERSPIEFETGNDCQILQIQRIPHGIPESTQIFQLQSV